MNHGDIRTETAMTGEPRRRKWTLRALTTVVLATGSVASLAAPAQAYDVNSCLAVMPAGVTEVDHFKLYPGSVDFGDGWHLGGSPVGHAVVCWGAGAGDVVVRGKLYADSWTAINAAADVKYYFTDGSWSVGTRAMLKASSHGRSKALTFMMPGAADVHRVDVRTWTCVPTNSGVASCSLVDTAVLLRGS